MRYHSERQLPALLAIVFGLIAQYASIAVYKCNNETTVCGCSGRPNVALKISGGQSALQNNWDWVVSLRAYNYHFCGGAILNEWYIITAAHCFENNARITSKMTVCAGTFRLSDPCHQNRTMHSIIFHPLYKNRVWENDIALVRLTTPFNFSDSSLTPICLPSADRENEYPEVGTKVVTVGWGNLETNGTSDELQEVILKVMDKSSIHCNHLTNHRIELCAGDSGKSMSKGDSGGPLMTLKASKQWELTGLASFIHSNATPQSGNGFTLIAPFIQFIQTHIYKSLTPPTMINCSCQCPRGSDSGYAYSTVNSLDGCVDACMAVLSNPCTSSNTYACLGENCTYSTMPPTQDDQPSLTQGVLTWNNTENYTGQIKNGKRHGQGTHNYASGDKYVGDWIDDSETGQGFYTWVYGDKYKGEFKNGKRHGQGTQSYDSGNKYVGAWINDSETGQGVYTWVDGHKYEGEFKSGKRHGQGTQSYDSGNTYVGDWIDDRGTGQGVYTWADGDKYKGEFKNGKRHGQGTQSYANYDQYEGDWMGDTKTGKGIYTWLYGHKYVGDWIDNSRTGKGVQTWFNGDKYVGDWIDDIRTGRGIHTKISGDKYEGQFKNSKMHGRGTYEFANGNKYMGDWIDDSRTGKGIYTWADGDRYEGHFKDGKMSGWGKMIYSNGTIQKGLWSENVFVYY